MSHQDQVPVVLGIDVGGTSSRAGVIDERGQLLALARGAGANLRSSAGDVAAVLGDTVHRALDQTRSHAFAPLVRACVAGIAGAGPAGRTEGEAMLRSALQTGGAPHTPHQVFPDPVVAFAAGSAAGDGSVLLAGTGAVAFRIEDFDAHTRADGLGWILGDVGGGIWLGIEGLRAATAALDGRGDRTSLTERALAWTQAAGIDTGDARQDVVRWVHERAASELGRFAPEVTAAAQAGDEVAHRITERAAEELLRTWAAAQPATGTTTVLAGSILTGPGPIRARVLQGIGGPTADATEPVVGAIRLAARLAQWPLPDPQAVTAMVTNRTQSS